MERTRHRPTAGSSSGLRRRARGGVDGSDAELIGARVTVHEPGTGKLLGLRIVFSSHTYKSGGGLETHFGLGGRDHVDVRVTLLSRRKIDFKGVGANRFLDLDLRTEELSAVETVR